MNERSEVRGQGSEIRGQRSETPPAAPADPATLAALPRRVVALALLLVPAVALSFVLQAARPRAAASADIARQAIPPTLLLPDRVWTSAELRLSARETQILETNDYVYRTYTDNSGPPVDLCIIFSPDNRKGTHPPDVCLEGSGSRIAARSRRTVALGSGGQLPVREIVAQAGDYATYYCYFYKVGDGFTTSFYRQQLTILWHGLTGRNATGALIRYSVPLADVRDLSAARQRVDLLLRATFPDIQSKLNPR